MPRMARRVDRGWRVEKTLIINSPKLLGGCLQRKGPWVGSGGRNNNTGCPRGDYPAMLHPLALLHRWESWSERVESFF